ncbi:MAG: hypothetical protein PVF05_01215 [Gemmatimonadales bacterium]|jgi:hypothetical protein
MLLRAAAAWCLLLVVAFVAAGLRVKILEPRIGEPTAHVVGSLAVAVAFAVLIWLLVPWILPGLAPGALLGLGAGWTVATVAFEFGFGRLVMGHPWRRLLHDYDLSAGRLWSLVLIVVLLMPIVAGWARR